MSNFSNNRGVRFIELRKSGIYSQALIDDLQNGNYESLAKIVDSSQRGNMDFMEPILYAVKNEHGTYRVYKYYGESLQNNMELARNIIKEEPELIENTPISSNPEYVLELSTINPKVVQYMSQSLKSNSDFAERLCKSEDKEVIKYVVKECKMPDIIKENLLLAGNVVFMKEAIKEDAGLLKYADNDLKNNYEFIKEISSSNKKVIEYVSDNTEEFGKEALTATKESLVDISSEEAISGFKEEKEKIEKEIELDLKDDTEKQQLIRRQKQLKRHIRLFERIKNGEVDPVRAAKLINNICLNLDEEYKKEVEQLLRIDNAILDKQKETNEKENDFDKVQRLSNADKEKIGIKKIEEITDKQNLSSIRGETNVTAKLFKEQTKEKELENGTNDARA